MPERKRGLFALCDGKATAREKSFTDCALPDPRQNPVDKASLLEALSEANRAIPREGMETRNIRIWGVRLQESCF